MLALESYIHGVWRLELMTRRVGPRGSAACHEGALTRHWAQHGCFIGNSCGPHSNSKAWWTGDDPRYRGDQEINMRCNVKGLCLSKGGTRRSEGEAAPLRFYLAAMSGLVQARTY